MNPMIEQKTRRPFGHKVESDGPDPDTPVATFLYKEDAQEAASKIKGYDTFAQYVGSWMRWTVEARRRSWLIGRFVLLMKDGTLAPPA